MARLTITLSENHYQALKEASARRRKSIGMLIAESLDFYGIKTEEQAVDLVARARKLSNLDEDDALDIANDHVHEVRSA
jgi:hypothetical protein